jgi:hypothetical protein
MTQSYTWRNNFNKMPDILALCFSKSVVRRATYSAIIVGSILILINHADALLRGELDTLRLFRIALTMIVPYIVSTVSSVITIQEFRKKNPIAGVDKSE